MSRTKSLSELSQDIWDHLNEINGGWLNHVPAEDRQKSLKAIEKMLKKAKKDALKEAKGGP